MIYVTDTHPLTLHLLDQHKKLGRRARRVYDQIAEQKAAIVVPTISLVETLELIEAAKLRFKYSFKTLVNRLKNSRFYELGPLTEDIVLTASTIPLVREERDRLIVATALTLGYQVITDDQLISKWGLWRRFGINGIENRAEP